MTFNFRVATFSDCDALAELINSAYRGESSAKGWTTEAHILDGLRTDGDNLRALFVEPDRKFLMAIDASKTLVGCVCVEHRTSTRAYLGMFSVKPTAQAKGVGRALLAEAERFARQELGASIMEMTVITLRKELIEWYERRGYKRTGKIVPFPVHPRFGVLKVDALEMEVLEKDIRL